MREYEEARSKAESEAIEAGALTKAAARSSRLAMVRLVAERGLTPERVWGLTRKMRIFA